MNEKKTVFRTLVMLIDFYGHPILGDEYTNTRRYSMLKRLLFRTDEEMVFVSNHSDKHEVLVELQHLVGLENRHTWLNIDPDIPPELSTIVEMVRTAGFEIHNIIIGGCNTSGCIINAKPFSAVQWAKEGYYTEIWLPLCAEYQQPGINDHESAMISFGMIYQFIKKEQLWDKIDVTCSTLPKLLGFPDLVPDGTYLQKEIK